MFDDCLENNELSVKWRIFKSRRLISKAIKHNFSSKYSKVTRVKYICYILASVNDYKIPLEVLWIDENQLWGLQMKLFVAIDWLKAAWYTDKDLQILYSK